MQCGSYGVVEGAMQYGWMQLGVIRFGEYGASTM